MRYKILRFFYSNSPLSSPTGRRRRLFSQSRRPGDAMSALVNISPGFITHAICCPGIADFSPFILASNDAKQSLQKAIWLRRSVSSGSILKPSSRSPRWPNTRLFSAKKDPTTVVRFNPVVLVMFLTNTGTDSVVHTTPITNDTKNTRRSHFRRHKSMPIGKLPKIV